MSHGSISAYSSLSLHTSLKLRMFVLASRSILTAAMSHLQSFKKRHLLLVLQKLRDKRLIREFHSTSVTLFLRSFEHHGNNYLKRSSSFIFISSCYRLTWCFSRKTLNKKYPSYYEWWDQQDSIGLVMVEGDKDMVLVQLIIENRLKLLKLLGI